MPSSSCHILLLNSTPSLSLTLREFYNNLFSFPTPQLLLSYLRALQSNHHYLHHHQQQQPTLLLIDLDTNNHQLHGIHLLKLLAKEINERNLDIPIIAIKNDPDQSFLLDCICNGADDVLAKPVQSQVVQTLWLKTLRRRQSCLTASKSAPPRHTNLQTPTEREAKRTKRYLKDSEFSRSLVPLTSRISTIHTQTSSITSLLLPPVATIPSTPHPQAFQPNYAPTVEEIGREKRKLASLLNRWDFDPRKLGNESEVIKCVAVMLEEAAMACGGFHAIGVDRDTLHRFIASVRSSYHADNPYHNFYHGVDVMQATFVFLVKLGLIKLDADESKKASTLSPFLRPHETFALLIAALCHDLGHPGVNNAYMVSSKSGLAELYNDVAVLENFHAAGLFALMRREGVEFFRHQERKTDDVPGTSTEYRDFRRIVTCSILATDMAQHAEYIDKIKSRGSRYRHAPSKCQLQDEPSAPVADLEVPEADRTLLAGILIKCADISNPARPFPIARDWSFALLKEFDMQAGMSQPTSGGADEGITATGEAPKEAREEKPGVDSQIAEATQNTLGDRRFLAQQPEGQIAFIEHFVRPLLEAVIGEGQPGDDFSADNCDADRGLSVLDFCIPTLMANRNEWERLRNEMMADAGEARSRSLKNMARVRAKIEQSKGRRCSLPAIIRTELLTSQSVCLSFSPHSSTQVLKSRRRSLPGSFITTSTIGGPFSVWMQKADCSPSSSGACKLQCGRFVPSISSAADGYQEAQKDTSHSIYLKGMPTGLYDIREGRAISTPVVKGPVFFKRARFLSREDSGFKHRYQSLQTQKGGQHWISVCHQQQQQQRRRKSVPPDWRLCDAA